MEETYKEKLFELISDNIGAMKWVQDDSSHYTDYECEFNDELKLRLVSDRGEKYLQIFRSLTDYRVYNAKDYPKVNDMLESVNNQEKNKRDEEFFKKAYTKLNSIIGKA